MAAETFLYNFNENRFFRRENRNERAIRRVCTQSPPSVDHLKTIDAMHNGQELFLKLTSQRPKTFFGDYICRCTYIPKEGRCMKKENDKGHSGQGKRKEGYSKKSDHSFSSRKSQLHSVAIKKDEQIEQIKCMLEKLVNTANYEGALNEEGKLYQKNLSMADKCRMCSEKLCLKCRMPIPSCCCNIPNFLFCKDCEKHAKQSSQCGNPFRCRKCDNELCLACRQPFGKCSCPKPNFFFCRICQIMMKTGCSVPRCR